MSANEITIGVELEFIISKIPMATSIFEHYHLVVIALTPLAEKLGTQALNMVDNLVHRRLSLEQVISSFQVQADTSIKTIQTIALGSGLVQRSAEIATPILRNRQWEWVIPEMTQILSSKFELTFNNSTGLHVHIGIGRPYKLRDLKRIAKAIVLFEKQMDAYHPACRCHTKAMEADPDYNGYILSNRESLSLANLDNLHMMWKIEAATDIPNLLCIICSKTYNASLYCRNYRYNLTSVLSYETVEFRQAIATDNGSKIVDWINRVVQFVTSAISTSDLKLHTWASAGITDPDIYRQFGVPVPEL